MTKSNLRHTCACFALAAGLFGSNSAFAQTAQGADPDTNAAVESPQIVVTGSLIRGSTEDSALPVDVISQEELVEVLMQVAVYAGVPAANEALNIAAEVFGITVD